jgi:hypothetical protein
MIFIKGGNSMPSVNLCKGSGYVTIELDDLNLTAYDWSVGDCIKEFKVGSITIYSGTHISFEVKGEGQQRTYPNATFNREIAVLSLRKEFEAKIRSAERKIQKTKKLLEELK